MTAQTPTSAVEALREMLELRDASQAGRLTDRHELDIVRDARAALAASQEAPRAVSDETRWVTQTTFYDPANPDACTGNCTESALASIFAVPLASVPSMAGLKAMDFWDAFDAFVNSRGFWVYRRDGNCIPEGLYLASGPSSRGCSHMVVMENGKLRHDPHPSREGIQSVEHVWMLVPFDPAAPTPASQGDAAPAGDAVAGAVWLMPVATDAPQNPKLQRYAWGRSNLTDAQMAHAYDCIVSAAQECGQTLAAAPAPAVAHACDSTAVVAHEADDLSHKPAPAVREAVGAIFVLRGKRHFSQATTPEQVAQFQRDNPAGWEFAGWLYTAPTFKNHIEAIRAKLVEMAENWRAGRYLDGTKTLWDAGAHASDGMEACADNVDEFLSTAITTPPAEAREPAPAVREAVAVEVAKCCGRSQCGGECGNLWQGMEWVKGIGDCPHCGHEPIAAHYDDCTLVTFTQPTTPPTPAADGNGGAVDAEVRGA